MEKEDPKGVVERVLSRRNIPLVGYAAVEDLPEGIDDEDTEWGWKFSRQDLLDQVKRVLPDARTVILFGMPFPPEADVRIRIADGDNDRIIVPYVSYLSEAAQRLVTELERAGYPSERFPRGWGFKHYGRAANLGVRGHHGMLINPDYGPRMRFHAMVTSAEIEERLPEPEVECRQCGACVRACPSGALSDQGFCRTRCRTFGDTTEIIHTWCSLCADACYQAVKDKSQASV